MSMLKSLFYLVMVLPSGSGHTQIYVHQYVQIIFNLTHSENEVQPDGTQTMLLSGS